MSAALPDFDRESHARLAALALGADADDIELLAREHFGDVAQQALAVLRDRRVLRPGRPRRAAGPRRPRRRARAAAGSAPADSSSWRGGSTRRGRASRSRRSRPAAPGRQQRASWVSSESTPTTSTLPRPAGASRGLPTSRRGGASSSAGAGASACSIERRLNSSLVAAAHRSSTLSKPSRRARSSSLTAVLPEPLQFLLDDLAAGRHRLLEFERVEPLPHLGARPRTVQVTELGIEPVAARSAGLRRQRSRRSGRWRAAYSAARSPR